MSAERASATPQDRWPGRLVELLARWQEPLDPVAREAVVSELWTLLNLALQVYVRAESRRLGRLGPEDVVDVAADKALDLLRQVDRGGGEPLSSPSVRGYLATVARNGVVDLLRRRGREIGGDEADRRVAEEAATHATPSDAAALADGAAYARALVGCLGRLSERARWVWILRVFYDVSGESISRHPRVRSSVGAVEVMLHRARTRIARCLAAKGHAPGSIPPGTYAALWEMIEDPRRDGT